MMKLSELRKLLPISEDPELNTTEELEHYFFSKPYKLGGPDYRDKAINFSIQHRLAVSATANNSYTLMKRFVRVKCPVCKKNMKSGMGFGNGSHETMEYRCDCGTELHLSIVVPRGITIGFK